MARDPNWKVKKARSIVIIPTKIASRLAENLEIFTHGYYQGLITEIGHMRHYLTYVPAQDQHRMFIDKPLIEVCDTIQLPAFSYPYLINRARTVDAIWFNGRGMPDSMFEVEHSTDIQNSITKFCDLQDFNCRFFIVAAESRYEQFKKIVSGEKITAEQKGRDKFEFTPYCKLIYSANSLPKISNGDDAEAVLSRLIIVPFKAYFDSSNKDFKPFVIDDLITPESMEYLINIGIKGLKRVLKNRKFTESEFTNKEFEEYRSEIDPTNDYINSLSVDMIVDEKVGDIYIEYVQYCVSEGLEPIANNTFSRKVQLAFGLTSKNKRANGSLSKFYVRK